MAMLMCMAVALLSCSKDDEELGVEAGIVGKWEIASVDVLINGQDFSQYAEEMAKAMGITVEEFKDDFGDEEINVKGNIEFKSDKSFTAEFDGGKSSGTWSAGDNRTLVMDYAGNSSDDVEKYTVVSLKKSSASLSIVDNGDEWNGEGIKYEMILRLKK